MSLFSDGNIPPLPEHRILNVVIASDDSESTIPTATLTSVTLESLANWLIDQEVDAPEWHRGFPLYPLIISWWQAKLIVRDNAEFVESYLDDPSKLVLGNFRYFRTNTPARFIAEGDKLAEVSYQNGPAYATAPFEAADVPGAARIVYRRCLGTVVTRALSL